MKTLFFAARNRKEILRDPVNLFFGLGFSAILLLLLTLINSAIPAEANMTLYEIESLAPGVAVFGLSFLGLFSATLISKDRCGSLILRLYISPMRASELLAGYCLPMLLVALLQTVVTYALALALGLSWTANIFAAVAALIPSAILNIAIGLLCGSLLSDKAVGGVCGALMTNLSAWLSGTWFSLEMIGGAFLKICQVLPFYPAVLAGRAALAGDFEALWPNLLRVIVWAVLIFLIAVFAFARKMRADRA